MKDETKVPPHVWRSLQWYIELENKRPEWAQWREYVLAREPRRSEKTAAESKPAAVDFDPLREEWRADLSRIRESQSQVEELVVKQQGLGFFWKILLLANTAYLAYQFFSSLF